MFEYSVFSGLSEGEERLKYLKKCIEEADREKNYSEAIELRYDYIKESVFNDDNFRALIMFPEFMQLFDEHPDSFSAHSFMTAFKWIIEDITDFYQISAEKAEEYFEEFKKRCQKYGYSLRTFYMKKMNFYSRIDFEKAKELSRLFRESERDGLSDCNACEASFDIRMELEFGSEENAVRMLNDMLKKGIRCAEVPEVTYGICVDHFTKIGRYDEAEHYAGLLMPMIRSNDNFLMEMAHILLLKSFTMPNDAYEIFCRYVGLFAKTKNPKMKFYFADAASRFFERIDDVEHETINMKLPHNFELFNEENEYNIKEMGKYFRGIAEELAGKFDNRNGNSYFSGILNYEYPSAPVKELILPEHGTIDRVPVSIAVPFTDSEKIPSPDEIIEALNAIPDVEYSGISLDEENGVISILCSNKKLENMFTYKLFVRDAEDFDRMRPRSYIPEEKLSGFAEEYRLMLIIVSKYNIGCEGEEYNLLLRLACALNKENSPAIVDLTNGMLLSADWAKIQSEATAAPPERYMFSVHGYPSASVEGCFDMITAGLGQFGSRELLVSGFQEKDADFVYKIMSQIASSVCTVGPLRDEGETSEFGVIYNEESTVLFSWCIPEAEAADTGENALYAVPVIYLSYEDADAGRGMPVHEIPDEDREKLRFMHSNSHYHIEETLANERFGRAFEIYKNSPEECELIAGMTVEIPDEYSDAFDGSDVVYVKAEGDTGVIMTGIEGIPCYEAGKECAIIPESVFFWRIERNGEYYFADDLYLL